MHLSSRFLLVKDVLPAEVFLRGPVSKHFIPSAGFFDGFPKSNASRCTLLFE